MRNPFSASTSILRIPKGVTARSSETVSGRYFHLCLVEVGRRGRPESRLSNFLNQDDLAVALRGELFLRIESGYDSSLFVDEFAGYLCGCRSGIVIGQLDCDGDGGTCRRDVRGLHVNAPDWNAHSSCCHQHNVAIYAGAGIPAAVLAEVGDLYGDRIGSMLVEESQ